MNPPGHVEAAAQVVRDFIRGQEAAARVDDAMVIVRDWLQGTGSRDERLRQH